jgi:histone H1/5
MKEEKDEIAAIAAADAAEETETDGAEEQPMKTPIKKTTSKPAKSPGTPGKITYIQMVTAAIIALKDRTGSSLIAIKKYILANNPGLTPAQMKLNLNKALKSGVKAGRFIKVKASFKIHPDFRKKMKAKQSTAAKKKPTAAELAAQREKDRKAAKEKARLDRIRKRKFPMEDLKLIAEDKELNVSVTLPPRPSLNIAFPEAASACKSDSTKSGLLEDAFHVYHFFRGDVGWGVSQKRCVAPFTLEQWLACVHQVFIGAAKRSRMLPPLMNHLFVVALQNLVPEELQAALTPASWSEVLMLYMDAMDRFYDTELSEKSNALVGQPIDTEYLLGVTEVRKDDSLLEANTPESSYLDKTLVKAHSKLLTHDPWMLSADELLGLLRALVDDLLANSSESAIELDVRLQETTELLKNKRSADANFRKLHSTRIKEQAELKADEKERLESGVKATRSNTKSCSVSESQVESAQRAQQKSHDAYEKACKSRQIRTEPIGSDRHFNEFFHFWNDPLRVFVLQRGKAMPSSRAYKLRDLGTYKTSWCSIDKRSVLEDYMESLDVRGERECNLYQALEPACKLVHDDVKVANEKKLQLKEKLELQRKVENAKLKCEFGRKSGRLAAQSEQEFSVLQTEIDMLEKSIAGGTESRMPDLEEETGLKMLRNFDKEDKPKKRLTRRDAQNLKEEEEEDRFLRLPCSSLWSTGNIDGTGIVGSVVWELLQLEERVERLASGDNGDRKDWIANLEMAVRSWHVASPPVLEDVAKVNTPNGSKGKKQKTTDAPGSTVTASPSASYVNSATQILTMLKVRCLSEYVHRLLFLKINLSFIPAL